MAVTIGEVTFGLERPAIRALPCRGLAHSEKIPGLEYIVKRSPGKLLPFKIRKKVAAPTAAIFSRADSPRQSEGYRVPWQSRSMIAAGAHRNGRGVWHGDL